MFDIVTFYQSRFFHFHPTSFLVLPRLELLFFPWSHFFQIQLQICPHLNQLQFQLSFQSVATKLSHVPKYKNYPRIIRPWRKRFQFLTLASRRSRSFFVKSISWVPVWPPQWIKSDMDTSVLSICPPSKNDLNNLKGYLWKTILESMMDGLTQFNLMELICSKN